MHVLWECVASGNSEIIFDLEQTTDAVIFMVKTVLVYLMFLPCWPDDVLLT